MTAYADTIRLAAGIRAARADALRLPSRIANDLDPYRIYLGTDGDVDYSSPYATAASLPTTLDFEPGHTYRVTVREVNRFGLESQNTDYQEYVVNAAGTIRATQPAEASEAELTAVAGGEIRLTAEYDYFRDADNEATHWIYYLTTDGSDPDPDADTPTETAMVKVDGLAKLRVTLGPYADGTTVKCIVRTRRAGNPDVDSESVIVYSATADSTAPADVDATARADAAALD